MGVGLCPIPYFWGDQSHSIGISEVFTKRDGISGVPMAGVDELHGYPGGFGACIASKSYRGGDVGAATWAGGHGLPWHAMDENGGINDVLLQGT